MPPQKTEFSMCLNLEGGWETVKPDKPKNKTGNNIGSYTEIDCYPKGCAAPSFVECQCNTRGPLSKLYKTPPQKNIVTSKPPVGDISVVTLIRIDTTLDHSQKAENWWYHTCSACGRPWVQSTDRPSSSEAIHGSEVMVGNCWPEAVHTLKNPSASLAQLAEHALRKRMATGSIPVGGFFDITSIATRSDAPQEDLYLCLEPAHTHVHTHINALLLRSRIQVVANPSQQGTLSNSAIV